MKRWFIIFGVVVVMGLGGGWFYRGRAAGTAPRGPVGAGDMYLALGDSLAAGWNAEPGKGYVNRLGSRLEQLKPGIVTRNIAVAGETSSSFIGRQLPQALRIIKAEQAAGKQVSPITLDIGGNDARNVERRTPAERHQTVKLVAKNLGKALDELLMATKGPHGERTADIVLMNYYNPWSGDPKDTASPAYWAAELNSAIEAVARARGISVADTATPFDNGKAFSLTFIVNGDIHANNAGHQVIADQFWTALGYR
ncbi:MAG: GDSL-type esterase/lipase family protein [Herpetosiphon sp.]